MTEKKLNFGQLDNALKARGVDKEDKNLLNWVDSLYTDNLITPKDLGKLYQLHKYQGFDRDQVLRSLKSLSDKEGVSVVVEIILICALKGPARAVVTQLSNGKTVSAYGIPKSAAKGSSGLSCNRVTAATADLAAHYLKKLDVPKKIDTDLPGWLQFPSAASIDLPERYVDLHKEFAEKFSVKIGGEFNEDIYTQMRVNRYLNRSLRLFD